MEQRALHVGYEHSLFVALMDLDDESEVNSTASRLSGQAARKPTAMILCSPLRDFTNIPWRDEFVAISQRDIRSRADDSKDESSPPNNPASNANPCDASLVSSRVRDPSRTKNACHTHWSMRSLTLRRLGQASRHV